MKHFKTLVLGLAVMAGGLISLSNANAWVAARGGWGGGVAVGGYHGRDYGGYHGGCYGCGAAAGAVAGMAVGAAIASSAYNTYPSTVVVQLPSVHASTDLCATTRLCGGQHADRHATGRAASGRRQHGRERGHLLPGRPHLVQAVFRLRAGCITRWFQRLEGFGVLPRANPFAGPWIGCPRGQLLIAASFFSPPGLPMIRTTILALSMLLTVGVANAQAARRPSEENCRLPRPFPSPTVPMPCRSRSPMTTKQVLGFTIDLCKRVVNLHRAADQGAGAADQVGSGYHTDPLRGRCERGRPTWSAAPAR